MSSPTRQMLATPALPTSASAPVSVSLHCASSVRLRPASLPSQPGHCAACAPSTNTASKEPLAP